MKKTIIAFCSVILLALTVACTGAGGGNQVTMQNVSYNPSQIIIQAGEEVTWINEDTITHTVTGDDFDSGDISAVGSYSHRFDMAGTYDYGCDYHPTMQGTVKVTEAGSSIY